MNGGRERREIARQVIVNTRTTSAEEKAGVMRDGMTDELIDVMTDKRTDEMIGGGMRGVIASMTGLIPVSFQFR